MTDIMTDDELRRCKAWIDNDLMMDGVIALDRSFEEVDRFYREAYEKARRCKNDSQGESC